MRWFLPLVTAWVVVVGLVGCDDASNPFADYGGGGGGSSPGKGAADAGDAAPPWDGASEDGGPWIEYVVWVDGYDATCGGHQPCFSTILAAVTAAPRGSTIMVREGTYEGVDLRDKVVRIVSESGAGATTLYGASDVRSCIVARDSTVWVSGFTMRNCSTIGNTINQGYGIFLGGIRSVQAHIENNVIAQNPRGGIFVDSGSVGLRAEVEIVGNRLTRNTGEDGAIKINLRPTLPNHGFVLVANNVISVNSSGISFASDTPGPVHRPVSELEFQIVNNTIVGNERGIDAATWNITLVNNILFRSVLRELGQFEATGSNRAFNNLIGDGQYAGTNGNFVADPLFVSLAAGNYHLLRGSPNADRGRSQLAPANDFDGFARVGAPDVGAFELREGSDDGPIRCGDGVVSSGPFSWNGSDFIGYEGCDDGNTESGDGCNDLCQWEPRIHGPAGRPGLIGASDKNVCVVRTDESVRCWGASLGPTPPGQYLAVAAAQSYACAIRKDGTLACWNIMYAALPVPTGTYQHLVASGDQTCALDVNGDATCWSAGSSAAPARYPGPFVDFAPSGACGLGAAGEITCFTATAPTPTDSFVQVVSGGGNFGCGLRSDGTTACWAPVGFTPPRVPIGANIRLSYGYNLAVPFCALRAFGGMTCWGGTSEALQNSQRKDFIEIAPNGLPCGLTVDRRVNCWGLPGAEYPHE